MCVVEGEESVLDENGVLRGEGRKRKLLGIVPVLPSAYLK